MRRTHRPLTGNTLVLLVSLFLLGFANRSFFEHVLRAYPLGADNAPMLASVLALFGGVTMALLGLLAFRHTTKPVLILFLLLAAVAAYFMDNFSVVIDEEMLVSVAATHRAEAQDLASLRLLAYGVLLGLLPAIAVWRAPLAWRGWRVELAARAKLMAAALALIVVPIVSFGGFYASFFREHKALRMYANPAYFTYSAIKYAHRKAAPPVARLIAVGLDAKIPETDTDRELAILVIGEAARADRFSLNGYARDTNPELRKLDAVSFTDFHACGTSTAASLPCMFMLEDGKGAKNPRERENVLDVAQRAGVNILWRDNNSDSKGVALRAHYEDFRSPSVNPVCDEECRDEGMLHGLQEYIDKHPKGDILIVLHQMGNHGPAYYKRYPARFERFKPACRNADLSRCTREEIGNAYDNAILYTDYFLSRVIRLLQHNDKRFETSLFYVADHGESLGENGVYLHGLPLAIAPREQTHIPAIMWYGPSNDDVDLAALRKKRTQAFTHAHVAHTVLGMLEIASTAHRPELDILEGTRPAAAQAKLVVR